MCSELERIDELRYAVKDNERASMVPETGRRKQKRKRTLVDTSPSSKRQRLDGSCFRAANNESDEVDMSSARIQPPQQKSPEAGAMPLNREAVIMQEPDKNTTITPQKADAVTHANRDVEAPGHPTIEGTSQVVVPTKTLTAREEPSPEIADSFESTVHALKTGVQDTLAPVNPQEIPDSKSPRTQDGAQPRVVSDEKTETVRPEPSSRHATLAPPPQKAQLPQKSQLPQKTLLRQKGVQRPQKGQLPGKRKLDQPTSSRSTLHKAAPKAPASKSHPTTPAPIIEWSPSLPPSARTNYIRINLWVGPEQTASLGTVGLLKTATMKTLMQYVCEREGILGLDFEFWLERCKFRTRDTPEGLGLGEGEDFHIALPRGRMVGKGSKGWYERMLGAEEVIVRKRKTRIGDKEGESDVSPSLGRAGTKKKKKKGEEERVLDEVTGRTAKKSKLDTAKTPTINLTEASPSSPTPPPPPLTIPPKEKTRSRPSRTTTTKPNSATKPTPKPKPSPGASASAKNLALEAGFGPYTFLNVLPEADRRAWVAVLKERTLGKSALEEIKRMYDEGPRSGEFTRGVMEKVVREGS